MAHPLRLGLKHSGQDTTIQALFDVWRIADEAGFDHVWDFDHLAAIGQGGTRRPVYEGWTLLGAIAAATRRVRFGCMVTGNTYRHPALLAKMAVTVDHLSGGRLEFGIGAAWAEIEHQMYGIEGLDHRVGRLRESLEAMISLWTNDRTTIDGRYYHFKDAIADPKPIQQPHPPIWIGAGGDQMMMIVARYADVWNSAGAASPEAAGEQSRKLTRLALRLGVTRRRSGGPSSTCGMVATAPSSSIGSVAISSWASPSRSSTARDRTTPALPKPRRKRFPNCAAPRSAETPSVRAPLNPC